MKKTHANTALACMDCSFNPFCDDEQGPVKQHRRFKRNEAIHLPKNKFQSLYAIRRGVVKASQTEIDGKEMIRAFYFAGDVIGYEAICSGYHVYSSVALTDTVLCEIPYENLLATLREKPEAQKHVLHLLSKQLNKPFHADEGTAEQKIPRFLLELASRLKSARKNELLLPMSRRDIGNYLRLTPETVSRVFSRLQKEKILSINQKRVVFIEPQLLEQVAKGLVSVCDKRF